MSSLTNNLKDTNAQRQVMAVSCGRHSVRGHLWLSYSTGAAATLQVFGRQILGAGVWDSVEAAFYELSGGTKVLPAANYVFFDGSQTANTGSYFTTDTPHTGAVLLDFKTDLGDGEADTAANPPDGVIAICKTEKFPDFDSNGNQINSAGVIVSSYSSPPVESAFFYSANPARAAVGWLLKYGKIKPSRINWAVWAAWRDYCAANETVDYRTLADFDGFGLTASYYTGTNFNTFVVRRIDPSVYFAPSTGAPASGVDPTSFSVKWEGFIKPAFTETYTFTAIHTNGVRVTIGTELLIDQFAADGTTIAGTNTGTKALTADTFYPALIEWNHAGGGNAEIQIKWNSASLPIEGLPFERLYPAVDARPRYEAHVYFTAPTTLDAMIETVLFVSNSIRQDIDGKLEFYCVEQLGAVFNFSDALPEEQRIFIDGTFNFARADVRINERRNVWEARFRDLDSQYLQEPISPVAIKIQSLIDSAGREITGEPIEMFNMTRWQARKVLARIVDVAAAKTLTLDFQATARAYRFAAGDVGTVTHEAGAFSGTAFQIVEHTDLSPEDTSDVRRLKLKEF